jgi:hypothetical protein
VSVGVQSLYSVIAAVTALAHSGGTRQQVPQNVQPQSLPISTPPYEMTGNVSQGGGNVYNPAIGLVADARAVFKDINKESETADFKEAELSLAAAVDPFLYAELFIAFANEDGETVSEVEEAFGTYTNLGRGLQGRFGKFKAAVGRINRLHTHALPYMDTPLVIQDTFGEEGLSGVGAEISYLFPTERYIDLTLEAIAPEDGPLFKGARTRNMVGVAHLRTFFDFTEDLSGQLGFSFANGPTAEKRASVLGVDYTMKWKPGMANRFWQWETEAYWADKVRAGADRTMGWFTSFTMQMTPKLFTGVRYDSSQVPDSAEEHKAWMVNLTLKPTEFHHWRLEFQHFDNKVEKDFDRLTLQFVWLIGAHPVHKY